MNPLKHKDKLKEDKQEEHLLKRIRKLRSFLMKLKQMPLLDR